MTLLSYFGTIDNLLIWSGKLLLILGITIILGYVQRHIFRIALKHLEKSRNIWNDAIVHAIAKPLHLLIWLIGLTFIVQIVQSEYQDSAFFQSITKARSAGIIFLLGWSLFRLLQRLERNITAPRYAGNHHIDKTTANAISRLLQIIVAISLGLVGLETLGIKTTGILTLGGASVAVLGFASQELLANFFGAVVVYIERPFAVGDWICSPDRDIEGTVEEIGWRSTRIRRFNQRALYVPNSVFNTIILENPSRMNNRAIKETLFLQYEDAPHIPNLTVEMEKLLREHPDLDHFKTTFVKLTEFDQNSLKVLIYCFTKTTQWVPYLEIQQDIFIKLVALIESKGLRISYPKVKITEFDQTPLTS